MQNSLNPLEASVLVAIAAVVPLLMARLFISLHKAISHPYHPLRMRLVAYRHARALKRRKKDDEAFWEFFDRYKQEHP